MVRGSLEIQFLINELDPASVVVALSSLFRVFHNEHSVVWRQLLVSAVSLEDSVVSRI